VQCAIISIFIYRSIFVVVVNLVMVAMDQNKVQRIAESLQYRKLPDK